MYMLNFSAQPVKPQPEVRKMRRSRISASPAEPKPKDFTPPLPIPLQRENINKGMTMKCR